MVRCLFSPFPPAVLTEVPKSFQEAVMWKHAKHPNIVPFLGVTSDPFQLVSSWMSGGNLTDYIKKHPDADRLTLVCFPLVARCKFLTPLSVVWRRRGPESPPLP